MTTGCRLISTNVTVVVTNVSSTASTTQVPTTAGVMRAITQMMSSAYVSLKIMFLNSL